MTVTNFILTATNISKRFGAVKVLDEVSIQLQLGEVVGLLGSNGAGKSTLLKCLIGEHQPDSGLITINQKQVQFSGPSQARLAGIETFFQSQALIEDLTVVENLFLGREITCKFDLLDRQLMRSKAEELFHTLAIPLSLLDKQVSFCSGGERQIVALARVFLFKAKVLFLDEPMNALSISKKKQTTEMLQMLKSENQTAILLISHELTRSYELCNRFLVMHQGRVIKEFTKSENSIENIENFLQEL